MCTVGRPAIVPVAARQMASRISARVGWTCPAAASEADSAAPFQTAASDL